MSTIQNLNLSRFQWAMLLLVYMVVPTTWAAPTASFTTDVDPEGPPYFVFLNAVSSSPWQGDNSIVDLQWSSSENGNILQNITTTASFSTAGTHSITLTVWDTAGNSDTLTKQITIVPQLPPTPSFGIVRTEGLTVYVNASASSPGTNNGSIKKYEYYVGNGLYHTVKTPTTSFTLKEEGTYTISLHVTDSHSNKSSAPAQHTVVLSTEPKPIEKPGIDGNTQQTGGEQSAETQKTTTNLSPKFKILRTRGCNVSVNASESKGNITKYKYSWQQTGSMEELGNLARNSAYIDISLPQPGNYTIFLKVFDENGNSSTNTYSISNVKIDDSCSSTGETTQPGIEILYGGNPVNESTDLVFDTKGGSKFFTIINTGDTVLRLTNPRFTGSSEMFKFDDSVFSSEETLQPGSLLQFSITLIGASSGEDVFAFDTNVEGKSTIELNFMSTVGDNGSAQPEIKIWLDGQTVDLEEPIPFETTVGTEQTKMFVVRNTGSVELVLSSPRLQFGTGLYHFENFPNTIPPDSESSFTITLRAEEIGKLNDVLVFETNDTDESTIMLRLMGTVTLPPPPTACFTVEPAQGNTFKLNSCSYDGVELAWSGDGNITDDNRVIFSEDGIHEITLTVTNSVGQDSMTYYVETPIVETLPVPKFFIEQNGNNITVDGSRSYDPDGGNLQYTLWVNGINKSESSSNNTFTFDIEELNHPENTIALRVVDYEGKEDVAIAIVAVENGEIKLNPVANFHIYTGNKEVPSYSFVSTEALQVKVFSTFEVDASSSFYPSHHSAGIDNYEWFFGSNETCNNKTNSQNILTGNQQNPSTQLRFTQTGDYFLCLQVSRIFGSELLNSVRGKEITVEGYDSFADDGKVHGGVLAKNQFLKDGSAFKKSMFVDIVANIPAPPQGEQRDAYVVAKLISDGVETWYLKTNYWQFLGNSLDIARLSPYKANLGTETNLPIYNGELPVAGNYEIYVVYLPAGSVVQNNLDAAMQTMAIISFTVK